MNTIKVLYELLNAPPTPNIKNIIVSMGLVSNLASKNLPTKVHPTIHTTIVNPSCVIKDNALKISLRFFPSISNATFPLERVF